MFKSKNSEILFSGVILGVLLGVGSMVFAEVGSVENTAKMKKMPPASFPYKDLRLFTEVFGRIKKNYVEPVSDKKLLEYAIKGMLSGLDPHSAYLNKKEYDGFKEVTTGQFGGLGIKVTMENGFVKVISPIDDTPAQRAGIKAGDLIIKLDKKHVKGLSLTEAVKIMRGKPGSDILLTIIRGVAGAPLKITITRAIIKVKSVKNKILEKDYGYLRISNFQPKTGQELTDAMAKLKEKNEGDLKGLVLDLRNNPGGVLNAAVAVSNAFLEEGLIVYTEGRIKNSEMRFSATAGDVINGIPLIVLINAGSASASEIVAGALQDHKRAIIMGQKSFGKASVQTILPTSHNNTAIKLTTARYYTPSGRSIQAEGIEPDIVLARIKLESLGDSEFKPIKEVDLTRHLENGKAQKEDSGTDNEDDSKEDGKEDDKDKDGDLAIQDYPLHQALTLLKGLSILGQHATVAE